MGTYTGSGQPDEPITILLLIARCDETLLMLSRGVRGPSAFLDVQRSIACALRRGGVLRTFCAHLLPVHALPHRRRSEPQWPALKQVTLINTARDAAYAIKALLELPEDRHVAWSVQSPQRSQSPALPRTISAYAGDDADFGNGPYLLMNAPSDEVNSRKAWQLFRRYFEDEQAKKIWYSCSSVWPVLSQLGTRPAGFSGDLKTMTTLAAKESEDITLQGLANTYLSKSELHKCVRIFKVNKLQESESFSRPWENISEAVPASVDNIWAASACMDASLVFSLFETLRTVLRDTHVLNRHRFSEDDGGFDDSLHLYTEFFVPLVTHLNDIQQRIDPPNRDTLINVEKAEKDEWTRYERSFLEWATKFSPGAKHMNLSSPQQLRQLLFAPCRNKNVRTEELPPRKEFKKHSDQPCQENTSLETHEKSASTFIIQGYGAKPVDYTKGGWPATSTTALRKAAKWPRAEPKGLEHNDEAFCKAIRDLLQVKTIRADWSVKSSEIDKLMHSGTGTWMSYEIHRTPKYLKFDNGQQARRDLTKMTLRSKPGNRLLVGQFLHLELELLYLFSGCESLRLRLGRDVDVHEVLAVSLFDDVWEAFNRGLCVYQSDQSLSRGQRTIASEFPERCLQARKLDVCMIRGGNRTVVQKWLGINSKEVGKLTDRWHELHPGVQEWQERLTAFVKLDGYVESILGRRMEVQTKKARARSIVEKGDVLSTVINGSVGDVLMDAVVAIGEDETLRALKWHVVFVDDNMIVLEGPENAVEAARYILENDLGLLKTVHPDIQFPLRKIELRSVIELRKALRQEGREEEEVSQFQVCRKRR